MRKLKLDLEELRVETFAAAEEKEHRGTVRGLEYTTGEMGCQHQCATQACYTWHTCMTVEAPNCSQDSYGSCLCETNEVC